MNNDLIQTFERLASLLKKESRDAATKAGLQQVQFDALVYLSMCNRYSDTPIAVTEYLGLTKGTVSQTLKWLETHNYINKEKDKQDKRLVHLSLTAEGKRLVGGTYPPPEFTEILEGQSKSVQGLLTSLLKQLLAEYQDKTDRQGFGQCRQCVYNRTTERGFRCSLTSESLSEDETTLICREFVHKT